MLRNMKLQLGAWGVMAATLLGATSWGCAEAHAQPPKHPEAVAQSNVPEAPRANASENADDVENVAVEAPFDYADEDAELYAAGVDDYDPAADRDPSALTEFREVLEPYGEWTEDAVYGTVWIPDTDVVGPDFAPYVTAGHWALTEDDEWIWVSDYEWGWVPFHYGRWVWISGRGWAWIPGRVYAPAWVVWRVGYYDDYYVGWAPMPPTFYWRSGVAVSLVVVPPAPYVFCSTHYIFTPHVHTHIVPVTHVSVIARHTRPYHHPASPRARSYASYARGPSLHEARIPARAVPRASHHPRALALAERGGRITTTPRARVDSSAIRQPARVGVAPGRSPAASDLRRPQTVTPRSSAPQRSVTVPRQAPSVRQVPQVSPRPTSPRPAPVAPRVQQARPAPVTPRAQPTRPSPVAPRVQPAPRPSAPKISPSPSRPSVAPSSKVQSSVPRAAVRAPTTRQAK